MALLHAGPFSWADEAIRYGRFNDFAEFVINRDQERRLLEIWLHKVHDKSYEDWKKSLMPKPKPTTRQVEATVRKSVAIAAQIIPQDL